MAMSRISQDSVSDKELHFAISALKMAISDLFTREHHFEQTVDRNSEIAAAIRKERQALETILALLMNEQHERLIDAHDLEDHEATAQ